MKLYDQLRQNEEDCYKVSLARLGDTATLAEDVSDAYESISQLLVETKYPPEHFRVLIILFFAAQWELERAMLDTFRAKLTDALQPTRRAIELAAFAAKIDRDPPLADVWLEASRDEVSYKGYRKKFANPFPKDDELLNNLGGRYDLCSKRFHGSLHSMETRAAIERRGRSLAFQFRPFESDDDAEPAHTLLWILDTHLGILKVFVRVFSKQLGIALKSWEVRETALEAKMDHHWLRWRPVLEKGSQAGKEWFQQRFPGETPPRPTDP
jgi:hypothetical protein